MAALAGCKLCKHAGNRKGSIQKHSKHNPCSCCPSDFVQEYQTCEAHPQLPCQCDFHLKEPQRHIDKVGFCPCATHTVTLHHLAHIHYFAVRHVTWVVKQRRLVISCDNVSLTNNRQACPLNNMKCTSSCSAPTVVLTLVCLSACRNIAKKGKAKFSCSQHIV